MLNIENHLGTISISKEYLTSLIAHTASTCFGVADLNSADGKSLLSVIFKKADMSKKECVKLTVKDGKLVVALHITVVFGTNISAIVDSVVHKIRYTVEEKTGLEVGKVTVFVDGMMA